MNEEEKLVLLGKLNFSQNFATEEDGEKIFKNILTKKVSRRRYFFTVQEV